MWEGGKLPSLCPSERIIAYNEEMEVAATAEYDANHHTWLAIPDWATRHDVAPTT